MPEDGEVMRWIWERCRHHDIIWTFYDHHTAYPSKPGSNGYDTLYLRYRGYCKDCNEKFFHAAKCPQPISDLFFENFDRCMAADPRVIRNKEGK